MLYLLEKCKKNEWFWWILRKISKRSLPITVRSYSKNYSGNIEKIGNIIKHFR